MSTNKKSKGLLQALLRGERPPDNMRKGVAVGKITTIVPEKTTEVNAPKLHRDGTVSYWSFYHQARIERAKTVPEREIEKMPPETQRKVRAHLIANTVDKKQFTEAIRKNL